MQNTLFLLIEKNNIKSKVRAYTYLSQSLLGNEITFEITSILQDLFVYLGGSDERNTYTHTQTLNKEREIFPHGLSVDGKDPSI